MENQFKVNIEKMVSQGYGLGFIEGKAIFIPSCYPGETHIIEIIDDKKNHTFARSINCLKSIKEKRNVLCPLFGICGGCQFLNVSYDYQLKIKKEILEEALIRIGKIKTKINEIIPSDTEFRYRNKGSFQVKKNKIGYCYPGTTRVLHFDSCLLLDLPIEERIKELEENNLLDGLRMINIRSNSKNEVIDSRIKRSFFYEEVLGLKFIIDVNSFFQVNKTIVPKWLNYIKSLIPEGVNLAVDLYCGVGVISQTISSCVERVIGIEINKRQIKQAKECIALNNIKNCDFIFADASEYVSHCGSKIDLLIINPPRVGMSKEVLDDIKLNPPKQIIYSSCNPDTFSRDASTLIESGYILKDVTPFDMFPQTHHLEVVGNFYFKPDKIT